MAPTGNEQEHPPLDTRTLTWAALLGRWVEFARSALALPDDTVGRRLRESVPDLIALQAVSAALDELDVLPPQERALGIDRAGVLIERHAGALRTRFGDELPDAIADLITEAEHTWREAGQRWVHR